MTANLCRQYNMSWALISLILATWLYSRVYSERVRYLEISENAPVGTRIGFIDIDNPPFLIVSVSGSTVDSDLMIEQTTGEIRTRVPLDRETRPSYSFIAVIQNVRIVIKVLDENDNSPNFDVEHIDVEFPENAPRDSKRALPPARDPDLDFYSTQQYTIVSGNIGDIFRLVPHRGRDGVLYLDLQINGLIDHETQADYQLMVDALDGGTPPLRSRLFVNITIQDVNDNPPVFEMNRYTTSISENTTVGTAILTVCATDADAGDNSRLEYFINRRQSDREEKFRIDSESGIIYINKPLDFESDDSHELVIVARDCGVQPLETNVFVSIHVNDVNDNQPAIEVIFLSDDATPKISEGAQPGEFVARISVSDPDSRATYSNATVTLSGGDGRFGLTTQDDVIYVVLIDRTLDREENPVYELSIEATDAGIPPLRAMRVLRIVVTDINDNSPQFLNKNYEAHVLETSEPGTSILQVSAIDADEGENAQLRYSLVNSSLFTIDENSGLITTIKHIHCESNPAPLLIVEVNDLGIPSLSGSATVRVTVHDINDNEPIFEKPIYNITVPENLPLGHCFLKVLAVDSDCGINAIVNYTMKNNINTAEQFIVHSDTGSICIRTILDRETATYHELLIIATDGGGFSSTSIVRILVTDVNDNSPIFQPREYNVTLRIEDLNDKPILRCSASDDDIGIFGQIHYGISIGNEADIFRINKTSGEIYVVRPDQLLRSSKYLLNVTASDAAGLKTTLDALVQITTISFDQKFGSCDKPRYVMNVKENIAKNTFIGTIKASTYDSLNKYYFVTNESDLSLEVDTGIIKTKVSLDREIRERYLLNVELHNNSSIGYCQVELIVEDVNDNSPVFILNNIKISISESYQLYTTFYVAYAIDLDHIPTIPLRYVLNQNYNQLFNINNTSGEIFLMRQLDFEVQQRHRLIITVYDGTGLSANLSLNVEVQDVNDNRPIFERNEYYIEVIEDIHINSQILQIMAVDLDTGNNARLSYHLQNVGPFTINPNNGWIILLNHLDREIKDRYELVVLATDYGLPSMTASASVIVSVLDYNDNEPCFEKNHYEYKLFENQPAGILIGTVIAYDTDLGNNAILRYSIIQANSSFSIDSNTGEIKTLESLDREVKAVHELVLEVRDQGTPSQAARVPLKVIVIDVNDNTPKILDPQSDLLSVREEQSPGTHIAQVKAFDIDDGDNAYITYTILKDHDSDGYNVFKIDHINGIIKTNVVLDHEECNLYRLLVKASDAGSPPRYSVRTFRVEVLALADNRPTFTSSSLIYNVREDVNIGESVGSVTGTASSSRVAYTLDLLRPLGITPAFIVDRITGQLVVAHSLDRENISEYHLTIRSLDTTSIGNPQSLSVSVKVNIEDVNDNSPYWSQDIIVIKISESTSIGSIIYNFIATDLDDGVNGDLRYSLVAGYPTINSFAIDSLTGILTLVQTLDYEECTKYILVFKAEDQGLAMKRLASTVTAKILILDENDNDPIFVTPEYTKISVNVHTLLDMEILRVIAVDKDAGKNGLVSYMISSGNDDGCFSVDYKTGLVKLVKSFSHSTILEITAEDHGIPPRKAFIKLTLTPSMEQRNTIPRLLVSNLTTRISENLRVGTNIISVAGTILSNYENITFSIANSIALHKFKVSNNGMVSLLAPLDYEEISNYSVPIFVRSNKILDITTLNVIVLDENDNSPQFKLDSCYTLTIPENKEISAIHSFIATDADKGKNSEIIYSITNGNTGLKFKLDPKSGVLSTSSLDREFIPKYVLTISAKDKGRPSRETSCNFTIIVLDVNDNAPIFLHNQYSYSTLPSIYTSNKSNETFENYHMSTFTHGKYSTTISEDTAIESSIMQIRAIDLDQGLNGKITYSIVGESTWFFRIDNLTGTITTAGQLDRECKSFYSFLVIASDSSKYEARQTSVPIEIYISDINDNNPIFEEYPYIYSVPISIESGQSIIQVKANDQDYGMNGEIIYTIFPHDQPLQSQTKFQIDENTGIVTVAAPLVQENGLIYKLDVVAMDKGNPPLSSKTIIEFRIGNVLDTNPILKFKNENYDIIIPENSTVGTEVIQVIAVRSDSRRQQIMYSIGSGNDHQVFNIDKETGVLKINNPFYLNNELCSDIKSKINYKIFKNSIIEKNEASIFEKKQMNEKVEIISNYKLTLVAKTNGPDSLEAYMKLIVRISDINDNPPIFTQSQYLATALEGNVKGEFVIKVSANDIDHGLNKKLLYHIVDGNLDNAFTINPPHSGLVSTNIVLDREIREKYRLTIIATDQGTPQLTGTAALSIRVIDINDNQPTFPEHKIISVSENTTQGTVLTIITANDIDSSPTLTYHFGNISHPSLFSIDCFSGRIILIGKLDAEVCTEYLLEVIASDEVHETATELTIQVIDINDNSPHFDQVFYITTFYEEEIDIQTVLILNATDDDLTKENNVIHYLILHPIKGFMIQSNTGILLINKTALLKPSPKEIELVIIAEDSGKPSLSTMCSVTVRFNQLKSNREGREFKISVKENVAIGTNLLRMADIDMPDNAKIIDESEFFEISKGKLIVIKELDREIYESHIIHISTKKENLTESYFIEEPITILIKLDDVNDNYPQFLETVHQVSINEDAPFGQIITNLNAQDNDLAGSLASKVVYNIISGNDGKYFYINESSGIVTVNASLDCDLKPEIYHLVIMACDSNFPTTLCTISQLHIHIKDVNDNSPKFPLSEYLEFIGENEPIGTTIFIAQAFDLDRGFYGKIKYSIVSATNNDYSDIDDSWKLFSIDSNTGTVTTCAIFDYEQRSRYTFTIYATDTGGRTAAVRVQIEIESKDEFYPQFTERVYHFNIKIDTQVLPGVIIGYVTATDRDKGNDGRVVYQLTSLHSYFKLNRTTGALIVKQKLLPFNINIDNSSSLIVSASSGKQDSLTNMTIIEILLLSNDLKLSYDTSILTEPMNINSNMTIITSNGLANWALSLLVILLLLFISFTIIFLYFHIKNRQHKNSDKKPGLNGDNNVTTSNSYVDPTAFDTIPIRSGIGVNENNSNIDDNNRAGASCQCLPPKYDEIPPYGTCGQSGTQARFELSDSNQSGSSGHGSAEDDGEDEEIRMINESQHLEDSVSNLSVHNTQEYLARLGIVDPPIDSCIKTLETLPLDNLHLFENEVGNNPDITTLIYGKVSNSGRQSLSLEIPGDPSMNGSLSSIVHSEEELTGSYNWDYLLDWGPQYQPLAHVFSEIARLKDDTASLQSGNSTNSSRAKCLYKIPPPPLLTSVAPRSLTAPTMTRGLVPRSPISHDITTFASAALSPSFSPSLSPLATRSPSISPLVPNSTLRTNQCLPRIPINDSKLRI